MIDLYARLGVKKEATTDQIKAAYRKLVKKHHPDVAGGDPEAFKLVQEAYDILMDANKRAGYDATGAIPRDRSEAESTLQGMLDKILRNADPEKDPFKAVSNEIRRNQNEFAQQIRDCENNARRLTVLRSRVQVKADYIDLVGPLLEIQIGAANKRIEDLRAAIKLGREMEILLGAYTYVMPADIWRDGADFGAVNDLLLQEARNEIRGRQV